MADPRYQTAFTLYPYARVPDQDRVAHHPVIVVGGGPVGLALALDLGRRGTPVLILDDHEGPGRGSKAICFSKRTLDICHRLGAAGPMIDKGVVWNKGRVFHGAGEIFEFDLLPEAGHRAPAFINLQQPYFEQFLFEAIQREQQNGAPIEIRGGNRVTGLEQTSDGVVLEIETQDGPYTARCDWLIACDGARSPLREMMDLRFDGRVFEDNFLIADVHMEADFPTERWFWFQPPFADAQSALLHKQPDNIWRIDFQLGWDIDREAELDPERIRKRVDAMLSSQTGEVPEYSLDWTSVYTFQCRRMARFRHGRVLFAGDSAHQVSPFGARGANSGLQDAENLAWKLDLVCRGVAPDRLLDSYDAERVFGADENILNSSRATDFLTPKSDASTLFRNAVLDLSRDAGFARAMVNSGRLSVPCVYDALPGFGPDALQGPDAVQGAAIKGAMIKAPAITRPGAACVDAPMGDGFLLDQLKSGFVLLCFNTPAPIVPEIAGIPLTKVEIDTQTADPTGALAARYLGQADHGVYLIRPDQHVVARWADCGGAEICAALKQACALEEET